MLSPSLFAQKKYKIPKFMAMQYALTIQVIYMGDLREGQGFHNDPHCLRILGQMSIKCVLHGTQLTENNN